MHVLALDSSDTQAKGAKRRGLYHKSSSNQGSLTYRVVKITSATLLQSVDEWVTNLFPLSAGSHPSSIMFVALHACGSLATDILRTSVSAMCDSEKRGWSLKATIVVGCCYNMMEGKGMFRSASSIDI